MYDGMYKAGWEKGWRIFIALVALIVGLFLAIPDARTYAHYAALNGQIVYAHWHRQWAGAWIAYGAPLGVYIFAFNNLYRFCVLVLHDLYKVKNYNYAMARCVVFALIIFLALISVVPFYGMAWQAHLSWVVIYSNCFARFCMNIFAFFCMMNFMFDFFVERRHAVRRHQLAAIDKLYDATLRRLVPVTELQQDLTGSRIAALLSQYVTGTVGMHYLKRHLLQLVSSITFLLGVLTALYLYTFAYAAVEHLYGAHLAGVFAVMGVIPTCILWGHDARFSWRVPLAFVLRTSVNPLHWWRAMHYNTLLKIAFLLCISLGVALIAVPSTISESMMAVASTQDLIHGAWMAWIAGPAFIGIYITGLIEISCRIFDALQLYYYPQADATYLMLGLRKLHAQRLRELRTAG